MVVKKAVADVTVVPGGRRSGCDRLVSDFEASVQASGLGVANGASRWTAPSGDYERIAESTVQGMVAMLGRKAGVEKRVHPHLLRHALATNLHRRNVNPVRDIVGHTSLAMIDRVYSHLMTRTGRSCKPCRRTSRTRLAAHQVHRLAEAPPTDLFPGGSRINRWHDQLDQARPPADPGGWRWYEEQPFPMPKMPRDPAPIIIGTAVTVYSGTQDWLELAVGVWQSVPSVLTVTAPVEVACWCVTNHNVHTVEQREWVVGTTRPALSLMSS